MGDVREDGDETFVREEIGDGFCFIDNPRVEGLRVVLDIGIAQEFDRNLEHPSHIWEIFKRNILF